MGLVQALGYEVPEPNAAQRAMWHVSAGWYYNMRASPAVTVSYQGRSVAAAAHEAHGGQCQAIWEEARRIYAGYEAYARRIRGRRIHIMVLGAQDETTRGPGSGLPAGASGSGRQAAQGLNPPDRGEPAR